MDNGAIAREIIRPAQIRPAFVGGQGIKAGNILASGYVQNKNVN